MTDIPEHTQTLNDLFAKKAAEWSHSDLEAIVEALRTQRERWNAEQATGSRKLVKSSSIKTVAPGSLKHLMKNIKL
jgi:hypothetical protein